MVAHIRIALDYLLHGDSNVKLLAVQELGIRRIVQSKISAFYIFSENLTRVYCFLCDSSRRRL